jgi:hypothetical protein
MTTDITDCTVLNRMMIEDDLERLRREGQATAVEITPAPEGSPERNPFIDEKLGAAAAARGSLRRRSLP